MDLGLLGAFLGGVLTLLSPCSAMLLPAFFSYAFHRPSLVVARTGVFYLGLITTLVPLGILAGTAGAYVSEHRTAFVTIASIVVIVLGLLMLMNIPLPALVRMRDADSSSIASVYALGTIYGLAGVCAGPLLGSVLALAALGSNALYGGIILLVFAAGMALPLLILALAWTRIPGIQRLVRPREVRIGPWRNTWTGIIGGTMTISVGMLLLITDGTTSLGGVLGATQQMRLESWVLESTGGISDIVVVAIAILAGAALWFGLRMRRTTSP
ncbi:MAG: cytochrome c biogenesis protein CcdA [Thermomicrobiales bacterium]